MANLSDRWDRHFLALALLTAHMSKDPRTQVGAVIVGPDREVRSTGFNGLPRGMKDDEHRLVSQTFCDKWMVHAERNAILNAARVGIPLRGCTLYLVATDASGLVWGGPPCITCAAEVIQAGIRETVAYPFKDKSRWLENVKEAGVGLEECGVFHREILLDRTIDERLVPRYTNAKLNDCICPSNRVPRDELGPHHLEHCPNHVPF